MVGAPAQSHQGNGAGHKASQSIRDMVNDIKRETGDWIVWGLGNLGWKGHGNVPLLLRELGLLSLEKAPGNLRASSSGYKRAGEGLFERQVTEKGEMASSCQRSGVRNRADQRSHRLAQCVSLRQRGDKYHLEPVITLKVGPQEEELEFVVDTGAERTRLLNVPKGYSVSKDTAKVTGAKGETFTVPVIKDVVIEGETKIWMGDVLLVPKAGSNLLGRDLQVKLGIGVIPEDGKMTAKVLKLGQEDEEKINKEVWAGERNRGGLNIDPISVTIEREDCPIRVRQYPISLEGREGLKPVIEGLIKDGTLEPCMSLHNTPILPVKKPDGSYRLVQDLREVNKRTRSRYPVVPNPYTLLSKVPPQHQWFSVVDLKDAFWACPLAKESRDIFAFEWEDPKTGRKQQLRWTKLPQGFTESPNLFGQALEKILQAFSTPPGIQIIQYVDDVLLSGEDEVEVREATIKLLNFLGEKGLRVSKGKLQFVEPEAKYLGHLIKQGVAHGVLVQEWGGVKRPVAYLSKMLDPVSHGWPVCIQAIAATAILVEESRKLTFGGKLIVCTPHAVRNVLNQKAEKWLTDSRMLKYEAILINSDDLTLEVNRSLNPAQFLYGEPADNLIHNCLEIIQYQTKVQGDLEEQALSEGEIIYVDGSSRCLQGKRMSGYAVVDGKNMQTIEKGKLPSNWSAQTCELYALKKALEYLAHKKGTIYTDSRDKMGAPYPMASTEFWSCRKDEPDFKENFDQVLLTTEAAIRTKERGWIHASRIKGPVEEPKEWTITSEPGDTKLTLKRGLGEYDLWEGLWKKALRTVLQEIQQTPDAQDSDYNDITQDHLCGEGAYTAPAEETQLLSKLVLDKICNAAEKSFYQIPSPEIKTSYVSIKQFSSENFLQFVDRLRSQVERQVQDPVVQTELIKEMAQRNANETCHRIILSLPLDPSPSLAQMIEACTRRAELFSAPERNPRLTHPKPMAAAAPGARRQPMSSDQLQHIICHHCKRPGHFAKACPQNQERKSKNQKN
ncbi:hypothetical protein DUI87_00951 [Hirundo rustica rustica]|uniref:Uncharacterized protein n=1 Tax=Hirundo rustica rustica TaxID=333673 RepID=A0A3M0L3X2_HIRRU|nr:hypothetical protein DUI87_00951 [Hirundo rustica rustica]